MHATPEEKKVIRAEIREAMPNALPIGSVYDGSTIVEVIQHDANDYYQPYLYLLADDRLVWIPA